jgi:hypothetical protein
MSEALDYYQKFINQYNNGNDKQLMNEMVEYINYNLDNDKAIISNPAKANTRSIAISNKVNVVNIASNNTSKGNINSINYPGSDPSLFNKSNSGVLEIIKLL